MCNKSTAVYFQLKIFSDTEGLVLQYSIKVETLLISNQIWKSYLLYLLAYCKCAFSDCPTYTFLLLNTPIRT